MTRISQTHVVRFKSAAVLVLLAALAGCHGDTDAGGATDSGKSRTTTTPAAQQAHHPVPTPPTADQIDPNSPRAVLGGTSTTQTGSQGASGATQPAPPPR